MRIVTSMVMPGGWHYEQPLDSGQLQRIEGRTYGELLERIFLFRLQHLELIPSGTATKERAEADLQYWVCSRWPHACTGMRGEVASRPVQIPTREGYMRPASRIEGWLKGLGMSEPRFTDSANAISRAKICVDCPLNQRWETGCGPCNSNVRTKSLLIRGVNRTGLEAGLKSCLAFGWLNEVAVWLDEPKGKAAKTPPPKCWVTRVPA